MISLPAGWSLVGYPINRTRFVNESFESLLSHLDSVHTYNASDGSDHWKVYSPQLVASQNDLRNMTSFYGYWVRMNQSNTWMVDEWQWRARY